MRDSNPHPSGAAVTARQLLQLLGQPCSKKPLTLLRVYHSFEKYSKNE